MWKFINWIDNILQCHFACAKDWHCLLAYREIICGNPWVYNLFVNDGLHGKTMNAVGSRCNNIKDGKSLIKIENMCYFLRIKFHGNIYRSGSRNGSAGFFENTGCRYGRTICVWWKKKNMNIKFNLQISLSKLLSTDIQTAMKNSDLCVLEWGIW